MNWQSVVAPAIVGIIGAVVAAFSALVKNWYLNRDMRNRARQQLELASARADFAIKWHDASVRFAADEEAVTRIDRRANEELEIAYQHAVVGFDEGRSAISSTLTEPSTGPRLRITIRSILLLQRGLRTSSKFVVAFFYISVYLLWVMCIPLNDPPEDDLIHNLWVGIAVATFGTILLRLLFGRWVNSREKRGTETAIDPPPPAPGTA